MGDVHSLILRHGVEQARTMAETRAGRQAIDAAAAIMCEERNGLGITHAGFAMTSLPHKRVDEAVWEREGYKTTLLIESGRTRQKILIGTPYGSVARLILLFLQTEAIRTGSPEVVLGRSLNRWIERMDLTPGGKTRQLVTEQARRISACRLTFFTDKVGGGELRSNGAFVRDAISLAGVIDDAQPSLWQDRVRLDDGFYRSLQEHPVPVREEAIRAISTRSMALDVYVWLALSPALPIGTHARLLAGDPRSIRHRLRHAEAPEAPVHRRARHRARGLSRSPSRCRKGRGGVAPVCACRAEGRSAAARGRLTSRDSTDLWPSVPLGITPERPVRRVGWSGRV